MNTVIQPDSLVRETSLMEEMRDADQLSVLVVTNTYPTPEMPGDSPQIQDQVQMLRARGVKVDVLYINRYRGKRAYIEAAWKLFRLSFQPKRYDLIHAYYGHSGFIARLQIKYPVVVTFLGSDLLYDRDVVIGSLAARFANGIIVQSEEMKRVSKRDDAYIVPFGLNIGLFAPYPREAARRELGIPLDEKLILFPWNPARPVKRFDIIREAVQIVQQTYTQVRLLTVFDQPHEVVAKYMNACDVLALASDHEGAPMALREAMACNLPIVSVDVGDVCTLISDTEGCYLCERDPADMAEKLILALKRGDRTNGAPIVRQADATWGADRVMELYKSVLARRRVRRGIQRSEIA